VQIIKRSEINPIVLPGRAIQKAVGPDAVSASLKMTMGFGLYSDEVGKMEPHRHAEEICYILSAQDGWVREGPTPEDFGERIPVETGMTLHIPAQEWHVFGFEPGGHIDIIFFYGQVDDIRPEEKKLSNSST
jgi:hypothetical protein